MLRAPATAPSRALRCLHTAAVALIAAATVTASLVGVSFATAAPSATGPVVRSEPIVYFSPNGDRVKDRARIPFTLAKRSEVTVKVRRTNDAKTVVFRKKLGKVSRGTHRFRWNGKNGNGRIVRDRQYRVVFVADQVARKGRARQDSTQLFVDTVYEPAGLTRNSTTVYPLTRGLTDQIGFRHRVLGSTEEDSVTRVELRITDINGEVLYTRAEPYRTGRDYPVTWDGRDNAGQVLPAGRYTAELDAVDLAGNAGTTGWSYVEVSGVPLVESTGTVTVPPTPYRGAVAASESARFADDRASTTGGDDHQPVPCGTVVPSTMYPDAGATSYRSSDACGGTYLRPSIATARGGVDLLSVNAPRGLSSVHVAMRGKPTLDGETDTAQLLVGMNGTGATTPVTSAAISGESVTTGAVVGPAWDPTRERVRAAASWSISTRGVDSYDVAAVTVTFTYLTPQQ